MNKFIIKFEKDNRDCDATIEATDRSEAKRKLIQSVGDISIKECYKLGTDTPVPPMLMQYADPEFMCNTCGNKFFTYEKSAQPLDECQVCGQKFGTDWINIHKPMFGERWDKNVQ